MKPAIKDFNCFAYADLYALYKDVYSTSEGMSETLDDKYPCLEDFIEDLVAAYRIFCNFGCPVIPHLNHHP
jgi:hypothetical protein